MKALAELLRARGFKSTVAWVLESKDSSYFYEKAGTPVSPKEIEIGGAVLPIRAYGWRDLKAIAPRPVAL